MTDQPVVCSKCGIPTELWYSGFLLLPCDGFAGVFQEVNAADGAALEQNITKEKKRRKVDSVGKVPGSCSR
jgi:hypothetical protein